MILFYNLTICYLIKYFKRLIIKIFLIFIVFLSSNVITIKNSFSQNPVSESKGLRIDLIHSGNYSNEMYSVSILKKQKFFSGPIHSYLDSSNLGNYKLIVYDSITKKILFIKPYSTLFEEWQTNSEARQINRSFFESLTIPFPYQTVQIEVSRRITEIDFKPLISFYLNPVIDYIHEEQVPGAKGVELKITGNPDDRLDIVFIPEGYTKREKKKFRKDAQRFLDYFIHYEPFSSNQNKLNFWRVDAWSAQTGSDNPGSGNWVETLLNSSYYTFKEERYLTVSEIFKMYDLASFVPYDYIFIIANNSKYGGCGVFNHFAIASADSEFSSQVAIHEFGHYFGGLGDEYYSSSTPYENFYPLDEEPWEPNLTTLVDFNRKWKTLLNPETPVPTPEESEYMSVTGVFEGGGYQAKGIYRPSFNCIMKSLNTNLFCEVCKLQIIKRISLYFNP